MKFSLKEHLDCVFQLIIIATGVYGLIYAARIPDDETIELPKKFVVILMYFAVLMVVYMELNKYKELQIRKLKKGKEPEEPKPYVEEGLIIDKKKALNLLICVSVFVIYILYYMKFQGGVVGP